MLTTTPVIVAVIPQNVTGTVGGISKIKEFSMKSYPADGPVREAQNAVADRMSSINNMDLIAATAAVENVDAIEGYIGTYDYPVYANVNESMKDFRNLVGTATWNSLYNACNSGNTKAITQVHVNKLLEVIDGEPI